MRTEALEPDNHFLKICGFVVRFPGPAAHLYVMARFLTTICALAAATFALALPAAALGQSTTVPPGQSEADQYFETVPDGKGNKSLDNTKPPGEVLTDEQIAALEQLGEEGTAAAQLAAATEPDGAGKEGSGGGSAGGGGDETGATSSASVAPGREGLGGWLWVILIGAVVAVGTYVLVRRRMRAAP